MEFRIWTELIQQSRGALHVYMLGGPHIEDDAREMRQAKKSLSSSVKYAWAALDFVMEADRAG